MNTALQSVQAQQGLVGTYADLFWDLQSVIEYVPNSELHCSIYVANVTSIDHDYMLMAKVLDSKGVVIAEYPVLVDNLAWFSVSAGDVVRLPGSLKVEYSNSTLKLEVYEKVTNAVTDSVSTYLVYNLVLPGGTTGTTSDWLSSMMMVMMMVMMMSMVMKTTESDEDKKKREEKQKKLTEEKRLKAGK